jgi:formylglycine-generating enzyme required for sulfatase activity/tRNA A-37 threonylcarbamoyl transferase component Bud32
MSYCLNSHCPAPHNNSSDATFCLACGARLWLEDRYRVLGLLGQGGFGKTFEAVDEYQSSKPHCVIKQFAYRSSDLQAQQTALKLFYEEAQHLQSLGNHPQIPALLAYFDIEGQPYLVQELVDGADLAQELVTQGRFNQQQIEELLQSLLPVLNFLHGQAKPVIHRDIKPANIIRRRSDRSLVLVDFGAAKQATQTVLARTGTKIGSPEYSAPEQIRGKPAFASDIFSLGVTAIHLLTGVPPFDLFDTSQDAWVWRDYLVDNPVDGWLGKVLDKMIVNALARRYQSAAEVLIALERQSQPSPPLSFPESLPVRPAPTKTSAPPIGTPQSIASSKARIAPEPFTFPTATLQLVDKINWTGLRIEGTWKVQTTTGRGERWIEDLGNGIQLEMVALPGGSFQMGAPLGAGSEAERPRHGVTLAGFAIGRFLVSQEQYLQVMGVNPSRFKGAKLPVEKVSWDDAQDFCRQLSAASGKLYRLPSEAEWEYACRAGTKTPFYCGDHLTTALANFDGSYLAKEKYRKETTPVGKFPANRFGLHDTHGNVWEWCADGWHETYGGAPIDGSPWINKTSTLRVIRGGSWFLDLNHCRSTFRYMSDAALLDHDRGFRVVCAATP